METIFENEDFRLNLTGHDYDFVGIIETKGDKPLTFFFSEELFPKNDEDDWEWDEDDIDESKTVLLDVYKGLKVYVSYDEEGDEEEDIALLLGANSYFRTRDDKSTGFLSDPRQRGQFLALVKNYCPEQLKNIPWA